METHTDFVEITGDYFVWKKEWRYYNKLIVVAKVCLFWRLMEVGKGAEAGRILVRGVDGGWWDVVVWGSIVDVQGGNARSARRKAKVKLDFGKG